MSQLILLPRDGAKPTKAQLTGAIPVALREFGKYPNVNDWLPGDLLLFHAVLPPWVSRRIMAAQEKGGYSRDHARWHHAAIYMGDHYICEAVGSGVRYVRLFDYIGQHWIRCRRAPSLTLDERWLIAIKALTRLKEDYSKVTVLKLYFQSKRGFWQGGQRVPGLQARTVICSQLFGDAYMQVTRRILMNVGTWETTPAFLSETGNLDDVQLEWHTIS